MSGILGSLKKFASNFIIAIAEYNASPSTLSDADQGPLQIDANGNLKVNIAAGAGSGAPAASALADGESNATAVPREGSRVEGFNGTTWDRLRAGLTGVQTAFTGLLNTLPLGSYNVTPPTPADGNAVNLQVDSACSLRVAEQNVPGYSAAAITTATTTLVKTGPGVLHSLIINHAVVSQTIKIYDGIDATGTLRGTITFGASLLSDPPLVWGVADMAFSVGLCIVTGGAFDLTVVYA